MQKKKKILLISSAPKDTIRQKALQKSLSDTFVLLSHSWTQKSEAQSSVPYSLLGSMIWNLNIVVIWQSPS